MKKLFLILIFLIMIFPNKVFAAQEIIVMDTDSGRILYEKNANEKRLIASITKIMTAIITIENADLNDTYKASEEILKSYGTSIYLEVGEKMKVEDLLYGLMLRSGNDAALVLANNVFKNEKEFVSMMNKKAKELGMNSTSFTNPHGLDEETKNYSTAHDMAIISRYASKNKIYNSIVKTKKYNAATKNKSYVWYNRNKLLSSYKYCTGGKNGYTPSAGKTLVTTASKDGLNLTIVTLNDPNIYETHESLYEYYFDAYKNYKIIDKNEFTFDKTLFEKELYIKSSFYYPLKENELDYITTKVIIENKDSKQVGTINIYFKDEKIGSIPVYSKAEKKETSLFKKILNLFIR